MWNLLWPMLMVVGANTVYNICAKSTPEKLNSFAALTINYGVAAALSLLLFFVTTGGEKNLIQEIGKEVRRTLQIVPAQVRIRH